MKNAFFFFSVICCLAFFYTSDVFAQAIKKSDLGKGKFKECGGCGVGCVSCTVCDDKEMKTNCKEYICDSAGTCEELPKTKNNHIQYETGKGGYANTVYEETTTTTTTTTNPANINYVSQKAISTKSFNRGKTKANVIQKGALKEGLNIINVDKSKTLEIVQQSGQIVSMFAVKNQIKSNDLIAEINTAKINSGGGKGLNFTCGIIICECTGDDDCNKMFEKNICTGSAYCDSVSGKCYCISF